MIEWNPSGAQPAGTQITVVISNGKEPDPETGITGNGDNGDSNNGNGGQTGSFDPKSLVGAWESNLSSLIPSGYTLAPVEYVESGDYETGRVVNATVSGTTVHVTVSKGSGE